LQLRHRQAKNIVAILLLSQGVPMILAGDELLRSQKGNNNCYCQDNELGWLDWRLQKKNQEMFRFTREMIRFRRRHPCLQRRRFLSGEKNGSSDVVDVSWHGRKLDAPEWDNGKSQLLVYTLGAVEKGEEELHIILNMSAQSVKVELPVFKGRTWHRAVDTTRTSPNDIVQAKKQVPVFGYRVRVGARSVVVFESR
jgi:glycogen operon protein